MDPAPPRTTMMRVAVLSPFLPLLVSVFTGDRDDSSSHDRVGSPGAADVGVATVGVDWSDRDSSDHKKLCVGGTRRGRFIGPISFPAVIWPPQAALDNQTKLAAEGCRGFMGFNCLFGCHHPHLGTGWAVLGRGCKEGGLA